MSIQRASIGLVFCVMGVGAVHAQAAQQTIDSAQKFLEQVLPAVDVNLNVWTHSENRYANITRRGKVTEVQTVARCHTRLKIDYPKHLESNRNRDTWNATIKTADLKFDEWTEAKPVPNTSRIRAHGIGRPIDFHSDSETLRARLAFALEFLRQNCDPSASTGF